MYLLYYYIHDCDGVDITHNGVFHTLESAQLYKKKLLEESLHNELYNQEINNDYFDKLAKARDEIAFLIREYLYRNVDAVKRISGYSIQETIEYLSETNHRERFCNNQMRFRIDAKQYWDRDRWIEQHFEREKLDSDPEFISISLPIYPSSNLKPVYQEELLLIEEVPLL